MQIYRWQITMAMSILHRASGIVLSVGSFLIAGWLLAVASGAQGFDTMAALMNTLPGKLVMAALSAALIYHLLNGLRHLLWDAGYGFEIPKLYATGWTVVALTVVLTAALWLLAARAGGAA